jgi:hypothetical protein
MQKPTIVPDNQTGASSDVENSVEMPDEQAARNLFKVAKERLLDVNNWHQVSGAASATFQLSDEQGNKVNSPVALGYHVQIDIPGPGNISGKGYDWVQVEAIEEHGGESEDVIAIRVRPTGNPKHAPEEIAHFFTGEASSTFAVRRKGKIVVASVNGRNEKPNLHTGNVLDKIRNAVIGATAIAGLNKPQWKSLVQGLLGD